MTFWKLQTIILHSALLLVPAGLGNLEEEMIILVDLCGCWVVSSSFQNSTFRFPIHSHSFLSVSKEKPIPNMICLVAKEKRTGRSHYQEYWWFFFKKIITSTQRSYYTYIVQGIFGGINASSQLVSK